MSHSMTGCHYLQMEKKKQPCAGAEYIGETSDNPGIQVDKINPIYNDPIFKQLSDYCNNMTEECAKQANDAYRAFHRGKEGRILTPPMFAAYPESPTAQRYMKAFEQFLYGWSILNSYQKDKVESIEDCEYLQTAFHSYAFASMRENHLFSQFHPPENTMKLIDQYLKFRPDDTLSEYFKVIIIFKPDGLIFKDGNFSNYEFVKKLIITGEEFAHKRMPHANLSDVDRHILIDLYYNLGAIYSTTGQRKRALDSFQKCYELDKTNFSALYGIAYQYMIRDPDKAISLFLKFIDQAPVCDKQYPNAHYMLGRLYAIHYGNTAEALRYYDLAEKAEKKRLSFLNPIEIPQKGMLEILKSLDKKFRK